MTKYRRRFFVVFVTQVKDQNFLTSTLAFQHLLMETDRYRIQITANECLRT